jgi:hypothetical protein
MLQVGLLRVVLSLEDKGAAATATAAAASPAGARQYQRSSSSSGPLTPLRSPGSRTPPPKQQLHAPSPAAAAATVGGVPVPARPYALRQQQLQQGLAAAAVPQAQLAPHTAAAAGGVHGVNQAASGELPGEALAAVPGDFRRMPEYLVAWELEVWKKVRTVATIAPVADLTQANNALFALSGSRTCSQLQPLL